MDDLDEVGALLDRILDVEPSVRSEVVADIYREHPEYEVQLRARLQALESAGMLEMPADFGDADTPEDRLPERLGDYKLVRPIGTGGMGIVWLARQDGLERDVALKIVRPEQVCFGAARARFQREVEAVARLTHPGLVAIYAVGEEHGLPYYAMELIHGASCGELVDAYRRQPRDLDGAPSFVQVLETVVDASPTDEIQGRASEGEQLPSEDWESACLEVGRRVAEALAHAHARGIVHRDVKPSNIMLSPAGRVVLIDFGLAAADGAVEITRTGATLGSLPWSSPEQLTGKTVDERSDVYSLAATLFEMLTGRLPFEGASEAAMQHAILTKEPGIPSRINARVTPDTAAVLLKALEKDPNRRYATASAFAEDLRAAREGRPVTARSVSMVRRLVRTARRHPVQAAACLILALAPVVGAYLYGWRNAVAQEVAVGRAKETRDSFERAIARAWFALGREELGEARRGFERADALVADSEETLAGRVFVAIRRELPERARAILQDGSRTLDGRPYLSSLLDTVVRRRSGGVSPDRVVASQPRTHFEHFLSAAFLLQSAGDAGEALEALERAIFLCDRPRLAYLLRYAQASSLAPRVAAREKVAAALRTHFGDEALAHVGIGVALAPHDLARARSAFARAVQLDATRVTPLFNLAVCQALSGDRDEAIQSLERALAIDDSSAATHAKLAELLLEVERADAAFEHARRALDLDERDAKTRARVASMLLVRGERERAWREVERARRTAPDEAFVHGVRGSIARALGDLRNALASHRRAVQLDREDPRRHYDLANTLRRAKKLAEAADHYERALRLEPKFAEASYNLALTRRDLGDRAAAIEAFTRASELAPRLFEAHYNLANNLFLAGRTAEAVHAYYRALAVRTDEDARFNLVQALLQEGLHEQAARQCHEILDANPRALDVLPSFAAAVYASRGAVAAVLDSVLDPVPTRRSMMKEVRDDDR